jgi:hypothetical protein
MVRPAKRALPLRVRARVSISHSQAAGSDEDQVGGAARRALPLRPVNYVVPPLRSLAALVGWVIWPRRHDSQQGSREVDGE